MADQTPHQTTGTPAIDRPPRPGVPVVDLTAVLDNVGGTTLDLGAHAAVLRSQAEALEHAARRLRGIAASIADHRTNLDELRAVLDGQEQP